MPGALRSSSDTVKKQCEALKALDEQRIHAIESLRLGSLKETTLQHRHSIYEEPLIPSFGQTVPSQFLALGDSQNRLPRRERMHITFIFSAATPSLCYPLLYYYPLIWLFIYFSFPRQWHCEDISFFTSYQSPGPWIPYLTDHFGINSFSKSEGLQDGIAGGRWLFSLLIEHCLYSDQG